MTPAQHDPATTPEPIAKPPRYATEDETAATIRGLHHDRRASLTEMFKGSPQEHRLPDVLAADREAEARKIEASSRAYREQHRIKLVPVEWHGRGVLV